MLCALWGLRLSAQQQRAIEAAMTALAQLLHACKARALLKQGGKIVRPQLEGAEQVLHFLRHLEGASARAKRSWC